jgi:hypothetical protein
MVHGLAKPDQEVENMGIIIEQRACGDISIELCFALGVNARVKILFSFIETIPANHD